MSDSTKKAIDAIRFLGVDAINKANSGHPGIVLGAAPMVYTLFARHLSIYPQETDWFNRDRFVLSAGHGSAMLYAINHLVGYDVSMDDLKSFRQFGNAAGHPEYGHLPGIESTTGPLGQGFGNAVGMAIAESFLAAKYNKNDYPLVDHFTYVLCGDGDLQEGVTQESASLAGHLGLGKLIVLFDSNDIQLDGDVSMAFSEDHQKKFEAYNWQYLFVENGNDVDAIDAAIIEAKSNEHQPTLIEIKTQIGYGSPVAGDSAAHGAPLGKDHTASLREALAWEHEPFVIPQDIYDHYQETVYQCGKNAFERWEKTLIDYRDEFPEHATEFEDVIQGTLPLNEAVWPQFEVGASEATRSVSGKIISALSREIPHFIGGSADLTASTKAKGADGHFSRSNRLGRNINFGVREHAMAAIINGLSLHGGVIPFVGGFFIFSDYMKPSMRLSAMMKLPVIYVFTHDSVAVGEDGPTHQPIEQLAGLRAIPNFNVIRPADAFETLGAWQIALASKETPTALILTRQNVTNLSQTKADEVTKGAYILSESKKAPEGILIATGSEVSVALDTQALLASEGIHVRVVSMPSVFLFEKQTSAYKEKVLPSSITHRLAIEMASSLPWYKYANAVYAIDEFGLSAPGEDVIKAFGFTKEKIAKAYKKHYLA